MVTISRTVEKIIEENPFIQEALSKGIINYVALAEYIKPKIEREIKASVKTSAVMMALRRLNEKLEKTFIKKIKLGNNSDIFVKSDLFEITIKRSKKTFSYIKEIYDSIDPENDFLTITQGLTQITIISNKRNKTKILTLLNKEKIVKQIDNLAAISTTLPQDATEEAGFFYIFTRAFIWANIPIVEAVSTLNELTFVLKEKNIPRSFDIFKEVIEKNS